MRTYSQLWTWVGILSLLFWRQSSAQTEETINGCSVQAVPENLLGLILASSKKTLEEDSSILKENVVNVKEKVALVLETIEQLSKSVAESKGNNTTKSANPNGGMLSVVLNTILTNSNKLEEIEKAFQKNSDEIKTSLEQINRNDATAKEENWLICESILKTVNNTKNCEDKSPPPDPFTSLTPPSPSSSSPLLERSEDELELSQKLMEMQNETNELVRSLIQETKEIGVLKNELQSLVKENQELRSNLSQKSDSARPADCNDLKLTGVRTSGVYNIYPDGCRCKKPIRIWCDMESEGGGWTVLVKRGHEKSENFTRSWTEYEKGFGHPEGEYWIGNSNLHLLTSHRRYSLRLEVTNSLGRSKWAQWKNFEVASADDRYKLTVGDFELSSTLGDVFRAHNEHHFSTFDHDNDSSFRSNCARKLKGGWWYAKCYDIHPTGVMNSPDVKVGVSTSFFSFRKKGLVPLKKLTLKIKPKQCVLDSTISDSVESCNYVDRQ